MLSATLALLWLALVPAVAPPACAACDCAQLAVEEAVADADAVFVGRVLGVNQLDDEEGSTRTPAMLHVEEEMKGELPRAVLVFTAVTGSICGFYFEVGERYLIYAKSGPVSDAPALLGTNICMRTRPLADVSEEELAYLRMRE